MTVGIAVGQSITHTASPLATLAAEDGVPNWLEIQLLVQQWNPNALIVGVPYQLDGSSQLMTFCSLRFINKLKERFKIPVHQVDEELSSWEAKDRTLEKYRNHKKKYTKRELHAHAAALLIEQWFSEQ